MVNEVKIVRRGKKGKEGTKEGKEGIREGK